MNLNERLAGMPTPRKIAVGAALVLLINSFLPWYHASFGPFGSVNFNGWHGVGVVAWLFVLCLLVIEGLRLAGVLPWSPGRADLATVTASAGTVLFALIYVIVRLTEGYLGFAFFIGILALVALAYGTFGIWKEGAARAALAELQASSSTGGSED